MVIKSTKILSCLLFLFCSYIGNSQVIFFEDFNSSLGQTTAQNGSSGNWIWSNSCSRSSMTGHSATGHALFSGSGCQFGNSNNTVSGDLVTSSINIGNLGAILTFNYALQNECGTANSSCSFDVLRLQISTNGGNTYTTLRSSDFNPGGLTNGTGWTAVTYTLTQYAGQSVLLRFNFNSGDGISNAFDGVYVDDIRVEDISPCTGTPGTNTAVPTTTIVCPGYGNSVLTLANGYVTGGLTYAWQSSTISAVGPFTPISNANTPSYPTTTLNTTTWYQSVITCTNSSQSFTTAPVQILVSGTTTNTVPYFEGFEGITMNNQLPNCSWSATNPTIVARTYTAAHSQNRVARTGSKFGSFYFSPSGTNYFYSNGILLHAGVTYSASVWYATDSYGDLNFTDLSLLVGQSQSTTGLQMIVSSNGPAASQGYKALTNTFTVGSTGMYYVAIRGTSANTWGAQHLNWDDLAITIPCILNTPSISIAPSASVICSGETLSLTATGADTYVWNTSATGDVLTDNPTQSLLYTVVGTNTASGCSAGAQSQQIIVNPTPQVTVFTDKLTVCAGQPAVISAVGAGTYTWNTTTGMNNNFVTVYPQNTSTFSVIGGNSFGCTSTASQVIAVNPLPTLSVTARSPICKGEQVNLHGEGANIYQWAANTLFVISQEAIAQPNTTTMYTLTGTSALGCKNTQTVNVSVLECVGIGSHASVSGNITLYPNPNTGLFTIDAGGQSITAIVVSDISGRVVVKKENLTDNAAINLQSLAAGVYYVKIQSEKNTEVIRMVKQ